VDIGITPVQLTDKPLRYHGHSQGVMCALSGVFKQPGTGTAEDLCPRWTTNG